MRSQARLRRAGHVVRRQEGGPKYGDLPTRLTAELAPSLDEDREPVLGIRFLLDGEPLYPDGVSIFDAGDDAEMVQAKIDAYLRARGVQDPLEFRRLAAAWEQLYFAPSYALPSC